MSRNTQDSVNLHYITRIKNNKSKGWYVRVGASRGDDGPRPKLFSDRKHGGKKVSLEKALSYRDIEAKRLGIIITRNGTRRKWWGEGVTFRKNKREEEDAGRWVASFLEHGKLRQKSFSIDKYGKQEAYRRAKEWREMRIQEALKDD